jgi:hypothetical protein
MLTACGREWAEGQSCLHAGGGGGASRMQQAGRAGEGAAGCSLCLCWVRP